MAWTSNLPLDTIDGGEYRRPEARAVQGLGGAVVSAVALSLIMVLFTEPAERAKAMGVFGFVLSGGGFKLPLVTGLLLFAVAAAVLGSVLLRASAATAPTDAESAAAPGTDHDPKEVPMRASD